MSCLFPLLRLTLGVFFFSIAEQAGCGPMMPKSVLFHLIILFVSGFAVFGRPASGGDSKNGPINAATGCRSIVLIRGDNAEPVPIQDCSQCIDCLARGNGTACTASAFCYPNAFCSNRCETVPQCSCSENNNQFDCTCSCTPTGVECSWTDSKGLDHTVDRDCPTTIP